MSILPPRRIPLLALAQTITPNAEITVDPFVDAFTSGAGFTSCHSREPPIEFDTLGDKIMTPVVYQNRGGTESLWAAVPFVTDANCTRPTGVRWYQFDVTGGNFPATPVQQQTWTNNNDGLWRWMPSIAVDQAGNTAIGYSVSSPSCSQVFVMPDVLRLTRRVTSAKGKPHVHGTGSQTDTSGRWGDYTMTSIDPADNMTFWHVNQYYLTERL